MKPSDLDLALERRPRLREYFPEWWHHHGDKMRLSAANDRKVVISGSAAKLCVASYDERYWKVSWQIAYCHQREWSGGQILMTADQLRAAFDLDTFTSEHSQWLINRYGGSSAEQGCYIRWDRFLNIPCPGTGHDGDPNISVELRADIKHAIAQLLR